MQNPEDLLAREIDGAGLDVKLQSSEEVEAQSERTFEGLHMAVLKIGIGPPAWLASFGVSLIFTASDSMDRR